MASRSWRDGEAEEKRSGGEGREDGDRKPQGGREIGEGLGCGRRGWQAEEGRQAEAGDGVGDALLMYRSALTFII